MGNRFQDETKLLIKYHWENVKSEKKIIRTINLFHTPLFILVKFLVNIFSVILGMLVCFALLWPRHEVLSKQNTYCFHQDNIMTEPENRFKSNHPISCDSKAHGLHQNLHSDGNLACASYSSLILSVCLVHQQKLIWELGFIALAQLSGLKQTSHTEMNGPVQESPINPSS